MSLMSLTMDGPTSENFLAGPFSNLRKVINGNVDGDDKAADKVLLTRSWRKNIKVREDLNYHEGCGHIFV